MSDAAEAKLSPTATAASSGCSVKPVKQITTITLQTFQDWKSGCGVRRIQKEYEALVAEAEANGKTVQEQLKANGFNNFHHFCKSCPQFSLSCWPTEFAELGSGYVLYFHFLASLVFIFVVLLLLQIPCLAQWGQSPALVELFQWEGAWQLSYQAPVTVCQCRGGSGFGDTCSAWDISLCSNSSASCGLASPGKWICRSWCYTKTDDCPTPVASPASMTNRHVTGGIVKSYSACPQDATSLGNCTGVRSAEVAYSETGSSPSPSVPLLAYRANSAWGIWSGWMTPGNSGPYQVTNATVPVMYTICVIILCVMVLAIYELMVITESKVDDDVISPSDFSIMVRGLPTGATDEKILAQWFRENAIKGKTNTEIVKVVIGWDIGVFRATLRKLKQLADEATDLEATDPKRLALQSERQKLMLDIVTSATGSDSDELKGSGVVVVTFRYASDMRACLNRWCSIWATLLYCEGEDTWLLPKGNNFWKSAPLPKYPIGDPPRPVYKLQVDRAPEPGDINWDDLGVDFREKYKRFAITNGLMAVIVVASFFIIYGFNKLKEWFDQQHIAYWEKGFVSIAPAVCVLIMNVVVSLFAKTMSEKEYHDSLTEQEASQALKMSIAMCLNTAGMLFFNFSQPKQWYQAGGLVDSLCSMLLINAFLPTMIAFLSDVGYSMKLARRWRLTDEKVKELNETMQRALAAPPKTEEEKKKVNQAKNEIEMYKRAFEPSELNVVRRFAQALKIFICCLLYQPLMPLLSLVGIVGLVLQYCCDKYLLLRYYARPKKPRNANIAKIAMLYVKVVGPIGLAIAMYVFLMPSWYTKSEVISNFVICMCVSVLFAAFQPMGLWAHGFLLLKQAQGFEHKESDYYEAQHMFSRDMKYHMDQILYKSLPPNINPEFLTPNTKTPASADFRASLPSAQQTAAASAGGPPAASIRLKGGKVVQDELQPEGQPDAAIPHPGVNPVKYGVSLAAVDAFTAQPSEVSKAATQKYGISEAVVNQATDTTRPAIAARSPAGPVDTSGTTPTTAPTAAVAEAASEPLLPVLPDTEAVSDSAPSGSPPDTAAPRPRKKSWPASGTEHVELSPGGKSRGHSWEFEAQTGFTHFAMDCQAFLEERYQKFLHGGAAHVNVKTMGMIVSVDFKKMSSKKEGSHKIRNVRRIEVE